MSFPISTLHSYYPPLQPQKSFIHIWFLWLIYLSDDGFLGCFYFLTVMNNAAMNLDVQVSVLVPAFNTFL